MFSSDTQVACLYSIIYIKKKGRLLKKTYLLGRSHIRFNNMAYNKGDLIR